MLAILERGTNLRKKRRIRLKRSGWSCLRVTDSTLTRTTKEIRLKSWQVSCKDVKKRQQGRSNTS